VPNFRRIGASGFWVTGSCVPSVTNVNNASVMTASFAVSTASPAILV
jgi:hypothetical protein